tara:strand:+ start:82 stop:513 length:432 start_codon:yes stop_codon:yes gene_type:complete
MQMTIEQLVSFLKQHFSQVADDFIVHVSNEGRLSVKMPVNNKHLRPGGTVSGPSMFALADVTFYLAILQKIGPEGLTVTTNATINFMRKPKLEPLVAIPQIHKLGRHLVVGHVLIYAASDPMFKKPVASANLTYSIPPKQETS